RAQVLLARATVATMAAHDVALGRYALADGVALHAGADLDDAADEFMADDQARPDHALRPVVPLVDMQVGAADRGLLQPDQDLVRTDPGHRHLFHPDALGGIAFDQGLHRLRHRGFSAVGCDYKG